MEVLVYIGFTIKYKPAIRFPHALYIPDPIRTHITTRSMRGRKKKLVDTHFTYLRTKFSTCPIFKIVFALIKT